AAVGVTRAGDLVVPGQAGGELVRQVEVEVAGAVELAADGPGREVGRVDVDVPVTRPGGDPGGQGGVDVGTAGDRREGVGQRGGVDPRLEERDQDRPGHAGPALVDVAGRGGADPRPLEQEAGLVA